MSEINPSRLSYQLRRLRNWLSLAGMVMAGAAFFAFVLLFAVDLFAKHANPYMGILAYVVAPMFLLLGLGMIVVGYIMEARNIRKGKSETAPFVLSIDLSRQRDRRILVGFVAGSLGFLFLTALGSYQTYHITESNSFCGETCHVPMEPEFKTYQISAHAHVDCVACHVGPGAGAYVRTKISGVRQLYHTVLGDFRRPIQLHNVNQRPAQETCESCHWRQKHTGDLQKTYRHFLADETNTPFTVRMILKVGGGDPLFGDVSGIHWHMNLSHKIEFIATDDARLNIPWVRVTDPDGKTREYRTEDFKDDPSKYPIRTMDCMDCHNRPSHKFRSPNQSVDLAMANGRIDPAIPWAKKNVVDALVKEYATRDEAAEKIGAYLREKYPDDKRVDSLVKEAQTIYAANFFPEMKADWRAYPDHIGHKDWNGCFRCHDGEHKTSDGKESIKASDCNACHIIIAQGAGEQLEKLSAKGFDFFHIDSEFSDPSCAKCHNGQNQEE